MVWNVSQRTPCGSVAQALSLDGVAAIRGLLFEDASRCRQRALRGFGECAVVFDLDSEMAETGVAAGRDREIHARITRASTWRSPPQALLGVVPNSAL